MNNNSLPSRFFVWKDSMINLVIAKKAWLKWKCPIRITIIRLLTNISYWQRKYDLVWSFIVLFCVRVSLQKYFRANKWMNDKWDPVPCYYLIKFTSHMMVETIIIILNPNFHDSVLLTRRMDITIMLFADKKRNNKFRFSLKVLAFY